jgi:NADH-quinone oxidoreductase subunit L
MGGLRKKMPITYITFLIACLAICGIPPFSGFFSKDLILSKAFEYNPIIYIIALLGALLTCFYMFRLLYLVFFAEQRSADAHPHESPKIMTIPLIILGILSIFGGFLNIPSLFGGNSGFVEYLKSAVSIKFSEEMSHTNEIALLIVSLSLLVLVILFAYRTYVKKLVLPKQDGAKLSAIDNVIYRKFYIDEIYTIIIEKPYTYLADFFFNKVENAILNPTIDAIGNFISFIGNLSRKLQKGNISFYLFAMVAGILLFIIFILII